MGDPLRGEIWMAELDPARGHEQAGRRPVLVISSNGFNTNPSGLVVVLPITSKAKPLRSHLAVDPGETGLRTKSFVISDQPRTIAKERLAKRLGTIPAGVLASVEQALRVLLEL